MGISYIACQCPNKCVMILKDDGDIETEGKSNDESVASLEDVSDIEFLIDGELLVARREGTM